jgi:hypothetical protein
MLDFNQLTASAQLMLVCKNSLRSKSPHKISSKSYSIIIYSKSGAGMSQIVENRRRTSYSGLLDSAMRSATKLTTHPDSMTKSLANQIMTDLKQIRRQMPTRRKFDTEAPRKTP